MCVCVVMTTWHPERPREMEPGHSLPPPGLPAPAPGGLSPSGPDRAGSRQREPGAAQAPADTWPETQLRSPCPQVRPCPSWASAANGEWGAPAAATPKRFSGEAPHPLLPPGRRPASLLVSKERLLSALTRRGSESGLGSTAGHGHLESRQPERGAPLQRSPLGLDGLAASA